MCMSACLHLSAPCEWSIYVHNTCHTQMGRRKEGGREGGSEGSPEGRQGGRDRVGGNTGFQE